MKNIAIGIFSVLLAIMTLTIIMSTSGRTARKLELENALTNAMETTLKSLMDGEYAPTSDEELIAMFEQAFYMQINSASNVTYNVVSVDYRKGLLKIEAVETFTYFTGTTGSVSVVKTAVLDRYDTTIGTKTYQIRYEVDAMLYRSYSVLNGLKISVPAAPSKDGKAFSGWKNEKTGEIYTTDELKNITCDSDMTFIAVFQ